MNKRKKLSEYYEVSGNGCWNWRGALSWNGYGRLGWIGFKSTAAQRVFYEIHKGKIKDGLFIDHLCRNRKCVNPEHLEAVTVTENNRRGARTTLKKQDVLDIRELNGIFTQRQIAKIFNISQPSINNIIKKRRWELSPDPIPQL
jgi:hypothetical protein|tara:strand:+ start:43 stop:474 length:432 start_codon:yes stop_codon:yes gene_type:complete